MEVRALVLILIYCTSDFFAKTEWVSGFCIFSLKLLQKVLMGLSVTQFLPNEEKKVLTLLKKKKKLKKQKYLSKILKVIDKLVLPLLIMNHFLILPNT